MSLQSFADAFAELAHRGQFRKYTGEPYIVHPRAVARLVQSVPHTDAMIEAALLHDVLEDTATTFETLHRDFGGEVAFMVFDLSDQIPKESGNRAFRKRAEADRLGQCSAAVQTIKVADLIDNTLSIVAYDPGFAKVYLAEKAYLLQRLTKADPILVQRAQELVRHHATDTVTSSTGRQ